MIGSKTHDVRAQQWPSSINPPQRKTPIPSHRIRRLRRSRIPRWTGERAEAKESLIAADITIEGKIEGSGHVRIAGKFKGDVNVQGDLTIEKDAKVTGSVRASKVTIAGELEGNIDAAAQVDLQQSGVLIGDLKASSLTVAAGSRMRGQVDCGWDDKNASKASRLAGAEIGATS